jgi:hypothetical protein
MGVFRERRRARRELAGLHGRYAIVRLRELGWHDCSLVDVSELGAGARLRGPEPVVGDEVVILFDDPTSGAEALPFRAFVRHERVDYFGAIRVGVEFHALTAQHRNALQKLMRSDAVSQLAKRSRPTGGPITHRVH